MKAYPAYKSSGVEWLGKIPESWRIKRVKHALERNDGGVWGEDDVDGSGTIVLRSTEQTVGGKWQIEDPATRLLTKTECASAKLKKNDLLITKSSGSELHIGKTSIVTDEVEKLNCCFSNFMQRLRAKAAVDARYVFYILNSPIGREQFVYGSNTTTGLANLNGGVIGNVLIALPQDEEQQAIADFLDEKCGRIDELIKKKERLIELLKEKRTAIISHAVTKGLDPNVKMKDSGIAWLGEIPEHWEAKRLKWVSTNIKTGSTPPTRDEYYYEDGSIPWYGPGSFADDLMLRSPVKFINSVAARNGVVRIFPAGSTMIVTIGATIGKVGQIESDGTANQQITAVTPDQQSVVPKFLAFQIKRLEPVLRGIAPSTTLPIMDQNEVGCIMVVIPDEAEQGQVVDFLDRETRKIDALVGKVQEAIAKLKEYRSAIITAAVTGKIDVRGC